MTYKSFGYWLTAFCALAGLLAGYWFTVGRVEARLASASERITLPDAPSIVYLTPALDSQDFIDASISAQKDVVILHSWDAVRKLAGERLIDALVIRNAAIERLSEENAAWMRSLADKGAVMVGIGVEDDTFAQLLGLRTFRVPGEADVPLGPSGYRLSQRYILGQSAEDVSKVAQQNWFERMLHGEGDPAAPAQIARPMLITTGTQRGELKTRQDIELFFHQIRTAIIDMYQQKADFHRQTTGKE
ncbi:hypothetical protein [Caldilinea sp.]|uniref:hypothetical protein n=1 Tax=Caldilinea sp. TaxID=2293560 RepID=UPI0021DEB90E|nr:hypothetical protein [Caldilinea sp.]GIV67675.1 MAG: hypothetical protein KatS3mg048_0537 [Caldilinea sp.]